MADEGVISLVHPHTLKKFELIEAYTEAWAHKLLEYGRNSGKCNDIVFIDCMCNSGIYVDENGVQHEGTPIRVARKISATMRESHYQNQQAWLYFNDLSQEKIDELTKHLPCEIHNFHIITSVGDGNDLLKKIGKKLSNGQKLSYLMVYDPYTASIDWAAIMPFFRCWGEVIINHMVSDSIRAVPQVKSSEKISKYEQTYLTSISNLMAFGSDRNAYSHRVEEIITALRGNTSHRYYIASYPFFNTKNALVYDLIHCTNNINGFKLYKSTAWKTFGGKSSTKKSKINPGQMEFHFDDVSGFEVTTATDDNCYRVEDIVKYIKKNFDGQTNVPLQTIWNLLDEHPVFPTNQYKKEIKEGLKAEGFKVHQRTIDFI